MKKTIATTTAALALIAGTIAPAHAAGSLYDPEGYFCSLNWRWVQSLCA